VIGNRLAFAPPVIISETQVDDLVAAVGRTLDAVYAEIRDA
jgi:adenosylmethionine-8-amino-7-oxononanoate aminotransferase